MRWFTNDPRPIRLAAKEVTISRPLQMVCIQLRERRGARVSDYRSLGLRELSSLARHLNRPPHRNYDTEALPADWLPALSAVIVGTKSGGLFHSDGSIIPKGYSSCRSAKVNLDNASVVLHV